MKHYLFMTAMFLAVFWAVGYFVYHFDGAFHLLLVVAGALLAYRIVAMKKVSGHHKHHKHTHS